MLSKRLKLHRVVPSCLALLILSAAASPGRSQDESRGTLMGNIGGLSGAAGSGEVQASRLRVVEGVASLVPECVIHTETNGRYACPDIPAGFYVLSLRAEALAGERAGKSFVFYPSTAHLSSAELLPIGPGEIKVIDLYGSPAEDHDLEIRNLHSDDVHYTLFMSSAGWKFQMPIDCIPSARKGVCRFRHVAAGAYEMEAEDQSRNIAEKSWRDVVVKAHEDTVVTMGDSGRARLFGRVVSDARLSAESLSVEIHSLEGGETHSGISVKPDGSFALEDLEPGSYFLQVKPDRERYVCSIDANGVAKEGALLTVLSGSRLLNVAVHRCSPSSGITGRIVRDAEGTVPVSVVAIESETGAVHEVTTETMDFSISGLAPGSYVVAAWQKNRLVAYANRSVRELLMKRGTRVEIEHAGSLGRVQLGLLEGNEPLL